MSSIKKEEVPPTPFEQEKDSKKAAAANEDSNEDAPAAKDSKAPRPFRERRHNVLIVRQGMKFRTLVIQAKNMLKNQFETIELHGVDD